MDIRRVERLLFGPNFGFDKQVANNANETFNSCSNLGFTYKLVHEYDVGSVEAQTFLTGEFRFRVTLNLQERFVSSI